MPLDDSTHDSEKNGSALIRRPEIIFLIVSSIFIVGCWIWFLFFRSPVEGVEKEVIQGKATSEILTVCNAAAIAAGVDNLFRPEDVKIHKAPPEGVSALVSTLEVSRNDVVCHWDGISAAQVTRLEGAKRR